MISHDGEKSKGTHWSSQSTGATREFLGIRRSARNGHRWPDNAGGGFPRSLVALSGGAKISVSGSRDDERMRRPRDFILEQGPISGRFWRDAGGPCARFVTRRSSQQEDATAMAVSCGSYSVDRYIRLALRYEAQGPGCQWTWGVYGWSHPWPHGDVSLAEMNKQSERLCGSLLTCGEGAGWHAHAGGCPCAVKSVPECIHLRTNPIYPVVMHARHGRRTGEVVACSMAWNLSYQWRARMCWTNEINNLEKGKKNSRLHGYLRTRAGGGLMDIPFSFIIFLSFYCFLTYFLLFTYVSSFTFKSMEFFYAQTNKASAWQCKCFIYILIN